MSLKLFSLPKLILYYYFLANINWNEKWFPGRFYSNFIYQSNNNKNVYFSRSMNRENIKYTKLNKLVIITSLVFHIFSNILFPCVCIFWRQCLQLPSLKSTTENNPFSFYLRITVKTVTWSHVNTHPE